MELASKFLNYSRLLRCNLCKFHEYCRWLSKSKRIMQIVLDASSIIKFSLVWNTKASLGLNKIKKLPNDHPQASEGPEIASAQISTDQPQILEYRRSTPEQL